MRILIFGLGSIGQRHVRLLQKYHKHELLAFRHTKGSRNTLGIPEIYDWKDVRSVKPDMAFITNPTSEHVKTAIRCASLGMHIFMEKPLANKLEGLDRLEKEISKNKIVLYTAYCLRFHPIIQKIKELLKNKKIYHSRIVCSSYLPHWRPGQSHRNNYSAMAKFGGGVFLDISHELDYIEYVFGSIVSMVGQLDRLTEVTVDVEDVADILITSKNGTKINLHLNYISRLHERTVKVDFEGGYLLGDLLSGQITFAAGANVKRLTIKVDKDIILKEQLNYYLENFRNPKIMNNFADSKVFIEKLLRFKKTWAKKFY